MSLGISNVEIKMVIDKRDKDLKKPLDVIAHFINFHNLKEEKYPKYYFIIASTDRSDKKETQWWSILDLNPKEEIFLFDSFSFIALIRK